MMLSIHLSFVFEDRRLNFIDVLLISYGYLNDFIRNHFVFVVVPGGRWRWDETVDEFCDIDPSFLENAFKEVLF